MYGRARGAGLLVIAADAWVLVALRSRLGRLEAHLAAPRVWVATVGPDRALIDLSGAAIWLVGLWLAAGLLAAAAARLPGAAGDAATRAARVLLPRVVHRLVIGSAGLGVLLAPVAAAASPSTAPAGVIAPVAGRSLPAPGWPVDPPARPTTATRPPAAHPAEVTVRGGDSLWLIAQRRLGPDATPAAVANAWPRWYAANRAAIGADPDLIHRGLVLQAPRAEPGGPAGPSSSAARP